MEDNICAISTALGVGAISIIRCSGKDVIDLVNNLTDINLKDKKSHTINYAHIIDNGDVIDEVLISIMKAPKTFTMEDIVEINSHGGIATTNKIYELLLTHGMRAAEPGEFTKRAFLNGRIDLIEAESINDLIEAESEEERKFAINKLEGNLSNLIKNNRSKLINLASYLEVGFDYPDEMDEEVITDNKLLSELKSIKEDLNNLLNTAKNGKIIKDGINIALVGKPNVGKSSILNHLLDEKKAIVTNIAGTTRDIVEGSITLNGIKINLIDTAGIRKTDDIVEKIGVDKSIDIIDKANLVIFVLDNSEEITKEELDMINKDVNKIIFINKNDLDKKLDISKINSDNIIYGNTVNLDGLDELKNKIIDMFNLNEITSNNYNYLSNSREIALVKLSIESINNAINGVENDIPYEMIAIDIENSYNTLGEIIGETYKEDVIDEIFKNFCVGK